QFLFAMVGFFMLVALGTDERLARIVALSLIIAAPILTGFYLAQRRSGQQTLRWMLRHLMGRSKLERASCDRCRLSELRHDLRGARWYSRQCCRAYGRLACRRDRGPDRVRIHRKPDRYRGSAGHRKSAACNSRSGFCHSRRARSPGGWPGAAMRYIWDS